MQQYVNRVPRMSFFIVILVIGGLLSVLSERLTIGPSWLIPVISLVLLIPMLIFIRKSRHKMTRMIALVITGMITVGLISSVAFLVYGLRYESELWRDWKPAFMDYLFLAFNTSAALGPTDTLVMSRRAKLLMNTQASISLVIVAVLAAHAIGAL